jgi:hypothetical protein
MISIIKTIGNHKIDIPIFSYLYKQISGGDDLTIFDAICLFVAIPATFLSKMIADKPLPKIDGWISKDTITALVNDKASDDQRSDFGAVSAYSFASITLLGSLIGLLDMARPDSGMSFRSQRVDSALARAASEDTVAILPKQRLMMKAPEKKKLDLESVVSVLTGWTNCALTIPAGNPNNWSAWTVSNSSSMSSMK